MSRLGLVEVASLLQSRWQTLHTPHNSLISVSTLLPSIPSLPTPVQPQSSNADRCTLLCRLVFLHRDLILSSGNDLSVLAPFSDPPCGQAQCTYIYHPSRLSFGTRTEYRHHWSTDRWSAIRRGPTLGSDPGLIHWYLTNEVGYDSLRFVHKLTNSCYNPCADSLHTTRFRLHTKLIHLADLQPHEGPINILSAHFRRYPLC